MESKGHVVINLCSQRGESFCPDHVCPCRAAFQYGIKMSEGRKTRRFKETNEKAELDRQWKKISAVGFESYGYRKPVEKPHYSPVTK